MNFISFVREHLCLFLVFLIFIMILIAGWKFITVPILAASVAVVVLPLHRILTKKIPAPLSATILTTLIFLLLAVIAVSVFFVFSGNIDFFFEMVNSIILFIMNLFHIPVNGDLTTSVYNILDSCKGAISTIALQIVQDVTTIVFGFILLYASLYLFIIGGDMIAKDISDIIPEKSRGGLSLMAEKTKGILFSLYVVHVCMAILVFLLALIYASVLGYGHVLFIAMMCGVFALIPMMGAMIMLIFIALYAVSIGDWYGLIITATVGYFLLCILIDFILRPKFTAKRVKIRPMLMFIGFFGGGATMGLIGFVLGPVFLVLGITGYEIFFKEMRDIKKKELAEAAAELPKAPEEN